MLNADALSQLNQLKKNIEDAKDIGEGIVRGTNNRYGFVKLDDGRDVFLAPDEMQRVLPGDRVQVLVTENDKKQSSAKLEKLISSELTDFLGKYLEKGKNHFVVADHPQLSRWLFIPPGGRKQYKDGDYVSCKITRHPFKDGKTYTKIIKKIGRDEDIGIEREYIINQHKLNIDWSADALAQVEEIVASPKPSPTPDSQDLRNKTFVTIDSEMTLDMDDALFAEESSEGWNLYTAIADPSAFIPAASPLNNAAKEKASSIYFPGLTLPMFPKELSQSVFSLLPGEERQTLVCKMAVSRDGEIQNFEFLSGTIKSHFKLSYRQVANYLDPGSESSADSLPDSIHARIDLLAAIASARQSFRHQHGILQDQHNDYHLKLNSSQKIESIERRTPTAAHKMVEEAMLATNYCAGTFLNQNGSQGSALYSSHAGFRPERLNEIKILLQKDKPEMNVGELETLEGYQNLLKQLQTEDADNTALIATLKRLLKAGEISSEAKPHFGLGFKHYAMITSPIRRYQDLHNQRLIKSILLKEVESKQQEQSLASDLQKNIINIRQASRQLEKWLLCQFMADKIDQEFEAKIISVSSQGIVIRLIESGVESFISMRNTKETPTKYDSLRMTLLVKDITYQLERVLKVTLKKVDLEQKVMEFDIADKPS
ncbi:exoribonuclease II [Aurantivibrio infirmus]